MTEHERPDARPLASGGNPYGTHRVIAPLGCLPQAAERLDNDFSRLFAGEVLVAVDTLNIDAASFAQMEAVARAEDKAASPPRDGGAGAVPAESRAEVSLADEGVGTAIAHMVLRTVAGRGKQHNPVTGSGGMLLGRVLQVAPGRGNHDVGVGDRIATLVSLTLTPLRIDRVHAIRRSSAQLDVDGEAVLFGTGTCVGMPDDMPERLALALFDVAGAAPQVARRVRPGDVVVVLGAGGKSGILCVAEARRQGGPTAVIVGIESAPGAAGELRGLGLCDAVIAVDARDPLAVEQAVVQAAGREADVTFSCINVPDAEMAAVLATREGGAAYFFAMSTSFTKAALGAEGVGKDVDLFIGNGFARGHAAHTLALVRSTPGLQSLFERRYG